MQKDNQLIIRLKKFIHYLDISNNKFADRCDISSPQMSNILNGANFGVSHLQKIIDANQELNIEWLLIGKGEMIKTISDYKIDLVEDTTQDYRRTDNELIKALKEVIQLQKEKIQDLQKRLKKYEQE